MTPRHTDIVDSQVGLMPSPNLELVLLVIDHNRMDDSHGVLIALDTFQYNVGNTCLWSLDIDQQFELLAYFEGVRIGSLTKLTGELLPMLSGRLVRGLLVDFSLHPVFKAVVMDEADTSCAFAGGDERVVFCVVVDPAEFAN